MRIKDFNIQQRRFYRKDPSVYDSIVTGELNVDLRGLVRPSSEGVRKSSKVMRSQRTIAVKQAWSEMRTPYQVRIIMCFILFSSGKHKESMSVIVFNLIEKEKIFTYFSGSFTLLLHDPLGL